MGIHTERPARPTLIFASLVLMLIALFTSRVGLTAGLILFLLFTCVHKDFGQQCRDFFRHPLLVGMSLLFFLPFVSGLWSENSDYWFRFVRVKLPLFLLPLGFAGTWQLQKAQWQWLTRLLVVLVGAGCLWSLAQYGFDLNALNAGYLRAQAIPTPLDDRVRFSLLVCLGVVASVKLMLQTPSRHRWWWLLPALLFAVYLHVLSVRTGLIGLYLFLLGFAFYMLMQARRRLGWILLGLALALPLAAWFTLPTFQNRIRYMLYDLSFVRKEQFLPGSNDGTRVASLRAGWQILRDHPFGVGMGDVVPETLAWYAKNTPELLKQDPLYPSSEWLMYGGVAGWFGVLLFSTIMLLPFLLRKEIADRTNRFFFIVLNGLLAFSFLFDIGLEVQYGVFIYTFLLLWWWKDGRNAP